MFKYFRSFLKRNKYANISYRNPTRGDLFEDKKILGFFLNLNLIPSRTLQMQKNTFVPVIYYKRHKITSLSHWGTQRSL